jgi:hypothetical protein
VRSGCGWTVPGCSAERQSRQVAGYGDLAELAIAIEPDLDRRHQAAAPTPTQETAIAVTM